MSDKNYFEKLLDTLEKQYQKALKCNACKVRRQKIKKRIDQLKEKLGMVD